MSIINRVMTAIRRPVMISARIVYAIGSAVLILFLCGPSAAQSMLNVSQSAWVDLAPAEREVIQRTYIVTLSESHTFGIIIDNQSANESTEGTSGGANLGGAIANAAYVDNALKGGSYSAKGQLAANLIGALLGSSLDRAPVSRYHHRYAVRLANGDIQYFDVVQGDAFRHPVGMCVSVPAVTLIDQHLCAQTAAILRATHIQSANTNAANNYPTRPVYMTREEPAIPTNPATEKINCKRENLAPVLTSVEKCNLINGRKVE